MASKKTLNIDIFCDSIADESGYKSKTNAKNIERLRNIVKLIICNDLTKRQKEICLLYYYNGMKMVDIAGALNIDKSTVSRVHTLAIKNIRERIKYYKLR